MDEPLAKSIRNPVNSGSVQVHWIISRYPVGYPGPVCLVASLKSSRSRDLASDRVLSASLQNDEITSLSFACQALHHAFNVERTGACVPVLSIAIPCRLVSDQSVLVTPRVEASLYEQEENSQSGLPLFLLWSVQMQYTGPTSTRPQMSRFSHP